MSFPTMSLHPSTEALNNRTLLTLKGRRAPPNTPPSIQEPADQAQIGSDKEHEKQNKVQSSCQHRPRAASEIVNTDDDICETCKVIDYAILAVESHRLTLKASASAHLHEARKDLLNLILRDMQKNASQSARRQSASAYASPTNDSDSDSDSDSDDETDKKPDPKEDQEFRKLNRMFERGCKLLGLDSDVVWQSFMEQEAREQEQEQDEPEPEREDESETEEVKLRRQLEAAGLGRGFVDFDFDIDVDGHLDLDLDDDDDDDGDGAGTGTGTEMVGDGASDEDKENVEHRETIQDSDDDDEEEFDMLEDVL